MKIKLIILLVFGCWSISAQETWTLEECVEYAIKHNLQLKSQSHSLASSKENYKQSIRDLLPAIDAGTNYSISYGRSIDPNNNEIINTDFFSNSYSLSSSIALFQGFQKINNIKASKFLYKAGKEDVEQEKFLLSFRVMEAFYDILFFQGLVKISEDQLGISETNFKLVQKQIELGIKAGADRYEAEATLITDRLNLTQSKNLLQKAQLSLIQEMNLKGTEEIDIIEQVSLEDREKDLVQVDSIYNKANQFMPMIKAQEWRKLAAKKNLAVARGFLYPSLSFSAGYSTGYFETNVDAMNQIIPFNQQFKDNTARYIGFSLTIPIFNRWSTRSNIKLRKIQLADAQTQLELQQQVLYQLIQDLVQEGNSLSVELSQSTQKASAQELSFRIAQKRFDKGLISAMDLNEAKNLLATAKNENLQVNLRFKINQKTLDFYKGISIFNNN